MQFLESNIDTLPEFSDFTKSQKCYENAWQPIFKKRCGEMLKLYGFGILMASWSVCLGVGISAIPSKNTSPLSLQNVMQRQTFNIFPKYPCSRQNVQCFSKYVSFWIFDYRCKGGILLGTVPSHLRMAPENWYPLSQRSRDTNVKKCACKNSRGPCFAHRHSRRF